MKTLEDIYVGYWREKESEKSIFPLLVPNSWRPCPEGKEDFLNWLSELIEKKGRKSQIKGAVTCCKICSKKLSSTEYILEFKRNPRYTVCIYIPQSFLHYVKAHNVRPPLDFFRAIRDRQMKNIKDFTAEICENTFIAK